MLQRILIAGSIALFVVTLAEVSYLLLFQAKPSTAPMSSTAKTEVTVITLTPSNATQSAESSSDLVQRYNEVVKNSAVTLATSHTVYEGKISEIDTKGGLEERLNLQYVLMLKIKGKGTTVSQIYFSQQDMGHVTILQKKGEQETPLAISSFKVGDSVILDFTTDALKPTYDNIINGKLTKL